MKSLSILSLAVPLTLSLALAAGPATAQKKKKDAVPVAAPADPNARKYNFSKEARPLIDTLNKAATARDAAAFAAALAPAQAAASTPDDRYAVAQLQLKHALDTNNIPAQRAALDALVASGGATPTELPKIYRNIGALAYNAKDWDKAASSYEKLIAINPNDGDSIVNLAELRNRQGRSAEGIQLLDRAIAAKLASGQKPDESWYKRAVGLSTDAKLTPQALKLGRDWLTAYPTAQNWRDALDSYRFLVELDDNAELDRFRLMRATGSLAGERAYKSLAEYLVFRKLYGEAKSVLDEGVAKRIIDRNKPEYARLISSTASRAAADRPTVATSEGRANSAATGSVALNVADAYLSYGEYAKAATFYRTALIKGGVDANLVNTRLGMALAMSGDRAGATSVFNAITGPRQDLARYWVLWLSQRA